MSGPHALAALAATGVSPAGKGPQIALEDVGVGLPWRRLLIRAAREPLWALDVASELARGHYYRWKYRLLGRRVVIGKRFRVRGPLVIRGPGTVIFGDDCVVRASRRYPTTPFTHSPEAVIRFADRVMLASTRFGCKLRIEVGEGADLSDARLMDTDFHAVNVRGASRRHLHGVAKPITIGPHVWVGAAAMVLKGVKIGANSVVGAGAVVMRNVPADSVVVGNPARVVWRLRPAADPSPAPAPAGGPPGPQSR